MNEHVLENSERKALAQILRMKKALLNFDE